MNKHYLNRIIGMGAWVVAFLFLCLPVAWGQTEEIKETFYVDKGNVVISEDGTYRITQRYQEPATSKTITVQTGLTVTVYLKNVNMNAIQSCLFDIQGNANVKLMLEGENTLKCNDSNATFPVIRCESKDDNTASLTIDGEGKLVVTNMYGHGAAIGSSNSVSAGNIMILGGEIQATGYYGAAIGGGQNGDGGTVTINGGSVTATNRFSGAAIGGGYNGNGTITINGGSVTATSSNSTAIGGGYNGSGTIIINGGSVVANGKFGAAIGGGYNISESDSGSGTITISGGSVTATSSSGGAAIGGGNNGSGTITISDGNVTATSSDSGAAIGGGNKGSGTITISGGNVTATSSANGAAIGGGQYSEKESTIMICESAVVKATSKTGAAIGDGVSRSNGATSITIKDNAEVIAESEEGASIGSGTKCDYIDNQELRITIEGNAVVKAKSVDGAAIGCGQNTANHIIYGQIQTTTTKIYIKENAKVTAESENGAGIGNAKQTQGTGATTYISGGVVMATSQAVEGIGAGNISSNSGEEGEEGFHGHFFTTDEQGNLGNAFIVASTNSDEKSAMCDSYKKDNWSGIIFRGYKKEGNDPYDGKIYGNPTLPAGVLTIPAGRKLEIEASRTLTIGEGTTLVVEGEIVNNGTIENNGVLAVAGKVTNETSGTYNGNNGQLLKLDNNATLPSDLTPSEGVRITFDANANDDMVAQLPPMQVVTKDGEVKKPNAPSRYGYTFKCWSASAADRTPVTSLSASEDNTYYAVWQYNPTITFSGKTKYTYGEKVEITATAYAWNGTGFSDKVITLTPPTEAGTHDVTATFSDDYNTEATATYTYTIRKKTLTAADFQFVAPADLTYDGTAKEAKVSFKEGITGAGDITLKYYKEGTEVSDAIAAGSYTVKVSTTNGTNCEDVTELSNKNWAFTISPKSVTVTPASNQVLFKDWTDKDVQYTWEGVIEADKNNLSVTGFTVDKQPDGTFILKGEQLSLAGDAKDNYNLPPLTDGVSVIFYDTTPDQVEATATLSESDEPLVGWTNQPVTLTAPTGFEFVEEDAPVEGQPEAREETTPNTKDFEEEGVYQLRLRLTTTGETYEHRIPIDKTLPEVAVAISNLSFTITAKDALSGIASVTVDGAMVALTNGVYTSTGTAGAHTVVVTDQAGNSTEEAFTLTAPPVVDPDPEEPTDPEEPEEPTPDPIYYTVTLPLIEGATTAPVAGEYEVEEGDSFTFALTLATDYDQSQPIVTTSRGETLTPRADDGKYEVRDVCNDLEIYIDGIEKNPDPVANETLTSPEATVRVIDNSLLFSVPEPTRATLFDLGGRSLRTWQFPIGDTRVYDLPAGPYILRFDNKPGVKIVIPK